MARHYHVHVTCNYGVEVIPRREKNDGGLIESAHRLQYFLLAPVLSSLVVSLSVRFNQMAPAHVEF